MVNNLSSIMSLLLQMMFSSKVLSAEPGKVEFSAVSPDGDQGEIVLSLC